jgi:hypothetical protein
MDLNPVSAWEGLPLQFLLNGAPLGLSQFDLSLGKANSRLYLRNKLKAKRLGAWFYQKKKKKETSFGCQTWSQHLGG